MQCSTERNTRTQLLNLNKIRKRATNAKRGALKEANTCGHGRVLQLFV